MPKERLCRRLHVALRVGGEQHHLEELVIRQAFGSSSDHPFAQPAAVPVIVRHSAFGELIPAMPHGVRERSHPAFALFLAVRAVYLETKRPYAIMVAYVEDPYAPRGVPYPAKAAGSGREP